MSEGDLRQRPKRGIEALDATAFLSLVLDHVSECFVAVDVDGLVIHINRPYCALLGGVAEDFIGKHITEVASQKTKLHLVARGGSPVIGEQLVVRGHELYTKQVPIRLNGEIIGAVGMALFSDSKQARSFAYAFESHDLQFGPDSGKWRAKYSIGEIVGRDPKVEALRREIEAAAGVDARVLILGETGTGKELTAHTIHSLSSRAGGAFVSVNCSTIPNELVESELFGYEGGAFTGARARGSAGKFELANHGTIFLDELGDLPLRAQGALLRVIEEGEVSRVGGLRPIKIDVRIVCATHRDLDSMVDEGLFREDLLYRLDVIRIETPSLRSRTDVVDLAENLLEKAAKQAGKHGLCFSKQAREDILSHSWPGNVRELRNVIERVVVAQARDEGEISAISPYLRRRKSGRPSALHVLERDETLGSLLNRVERAALDQALSESMGNKSEAAKRLGIDRTTLYKKLADQGF